ncbi:MAG: class B sortase [Acutalibacteraceae bacterium]
MKKRMLAFLIGVLGILCVICGVILLQGQRAPETGTPVLSSSPPETAAPESAVSVSGAEKTPYVSPIDFEALQSKNPDIYAWLRIPGTEFDFPLVQRSGDDTFYLTHDSDGNESSAGAIFTESAYNGTDMEDPVTVAYGHQMQAGTMFGRLQATYSEKESLKEYGEMIVYLPDKELHYTVFAAVPYDNRHILYQYDFSSGRHYNAFLNSIFEVREIGAQMSSEITVSPEDKLLILSTCMQGNPQRRYLVLAKCVKEID